MNASAALGITMRRRFIRKQLLAITSLTLAFSASGTTQAKDSYECGGAVETSVWRLWDTHARVFVRDQLLGDRLFRESDTYALYDLQSYLQNLEAMGQRCGRVDRLIQLADDLMKAYAKLEQLKEGSAEMAWICKGGAICNERNRLVGKEVMLVSAQGLGLMSALADDLANAKDPKARKHPFVAKTAEVSARHLLRWGDEKALQNWSRLASAKAEDVKDGSSTLFFTDKELWQIAIYANLAGIYAAQPELLASFDMNARQRHQMANLILALLKLFNARTTVSAASHPVLGQVLLADIDRGYSRLFTDNRYAGYTGTETPAFCGSGQSDSKPQLMVSPNSVPIVDGLGWDISHARRLVHALNALQKNRTSMSQVYSLSSSELPPTNTTAAFAAQLVAHVWNGSKQTPLFANYWNGANGWYRVAYNNGTGVCYSGYPPFGLSDSFATGGYATWSIFYPLIGEIARAIYELAQAKDEAGLAYTEKYLAGMAPDASANTRMLTQLMFWPSLVQ